jgi:hypothetical protein
MLRSEYPSKGSVISSPPVVKDHTNQHHNLGWGGGQEGEKGKGRQRTGVRRAGLDPRGLFEGLGRVLIMLPF